MVAGLAMAAGMVAVFIQAVRHCSRTVVFPIIMLEMVCFPVGLLPAETAAALT